MFVEPTNSPPDNEFPTKSQPVDASNSSRPFRRAGGAADDEDNKMPSRPIPRNAFVAEFIAIPHAEAQQGYGRGDPTVTDDENPAC